MRVSSKAAHHRKAPTPKLGVKGKDEGTMARDHECTKARRHDCMIARNVK